MFAPYESIEWIQWRSVEKKLILTKDWFNIVKEWNTNKLYLEEYPNNSLIDNIQDFEILEKNKKYTILKIFFNENNYSLIKITDIERKEVNRLNRIQVNWIMENEIIKKDEITINYFIYWKEKIENCDSIYVEWESNLIWKSIWEYTKDELMFKRKYLKETITQKLFNLFLK